MLMNKIRQDINDREDLPCLLTGSHNIVKIPIFPKLIYKCKAIASKIPEKNFIDI